MYFIPDHGNTETYLIQGADVNLQSNAPFVGQIESMNTNQAPEYFVDPGMYLPTATNYGYYCTGFQSSGEWDDHLRLFGLDGSDVYMGAQAENIPYVCYTPSFGYGDSAYNPYNPYIPGAVMGVDGSYVGTQPYYTVSPYQNPAASSSGYIPVLVQSRPDVVASSSTDPMIDRGSSATNTISAAGMKNTNTAASARFSFTPGKSVSSQASPFMRASESTRINSGTSKPSLTHRTNAGRNYEASSFLPQGGNSSISSQIMDNVSRRKVVPSQNESNVPMPIDGLFTAYDPNTAGRAVMDGCWPNFYDSKMASDTNGVPDMLAEQNRGPRTDKSRHEIIVRACTTKAGEINPQGNIVISTNEYNKDDFRVDYANAKFFVIKSYSEDDVHKSIKYNVWSSTTNGNRKLNSGYEDAQLLASGKPRGCPVFLYFSVNASGQFCGVAEMVGPVDFSKNMDFWQQDKWSGSFPVKWHIIKDVPNNNFRHIILENNEHRPVTNSRDTQEIMYNQGMEMLKIFKNYAAKTSLLDDFMYYEDRQRIMLEERARLLGKANFTPLEPYGKVNRVGLSKEGQREPPLNYHNGSRMMTESVTEQVSLSSDVNGAVNDIMVSNLRIGSLSINPKQTEQRVSMGAPPVSSGSTRIGNGAADNIVTVGSVPLKVNGLDRSSGVLTVGSIPLDPKALQPEKRIVSGKGGSQK